MPYLSGVLNERNNSYSYVQFKDAGVAEANANGNVLSIICTATVGAHTVSWAGVAHSFVPVGAGPGDDFVIFRVKATKTGSGSAGASGTLADVNVTVTQTQATPYTLPSNQPVVMPHMSVVDVDPLT